MDTYYDLRRGEPALDAVVLMPVNDEGRKVVNVEALKILVDAGAGSILTARRTIYALMRGGYVTFLDVFRDDEPQWLLLPGIGPTNADVLYRLKWAELA